MTSDQQPVETRTVGAGLFGFPIPQPEPANAAEDVPDALLTDTDGEGSEP